MRPLTNLIFAEIKNDDDPFETNVKPLLFEFKYQKYDKLVYYSLICFNNRR